MTEQLLSYFNRDELASSVWKGKYAQEGEETPDDMHRREAKEFAKIEAKYFHEEGTLLVEDPDITMNLSDYGQNREFLTEEKIYELFKDFKYIVPQGSIMSQLGSKSIGSLSNCFVIGQPYDSYGGILKKDEELAQLMKRRGGVGIDISTLRPSGVSTTNSAKSSTGAVSFMHRFSNTTREVAQNGRRGALMISIDVNHPDVMEFIKIKRDLSQVTGANISIKLNDEFMKAVDRDQDYILTFPCDARNFFGNVDYFDGEYDKLYEDGVRYYKKIKAREYWEEIIKSAHQSAEPGIIFETNHHNYSPDGLYPQYRGVTTNPCGEIFMQPYDACRLIALNLYSFVIEPFTKRAKFDSKKFYEISYEAMRLSDDLIDLEIEHINRIIDKIKRDPEPLEVKRTELELWENILSTARSSRRTGLGFTALGDTLAALGLPYDSDKGIEFIDSIMKTKMTAELDCTIDLAVLRGKFDGCDNGVDGIEEKKGNSFYQFIYEQFPEQYARMREFGRRNVSWSTVAPTGTVSLLTQTTSGIEPVFSIHPYVRRKKVNPNDENVRIDFVDDSGDNWQEFAVIHPKLLDYIKTFQGAVDSDEIMFLHEIKETKEDEERLVRLVSEFIQSTTTPWDGSSANDIDWIKRVEIQGIIQKYTTHSISSTINLPNSVSEEEVSTIYLEAWKKGLKGITVYRDGSRSGVLVSKNKDTHDWVDSVKRPKKLEGESHVVTVKGEKYTVMVGLLDKKPYEVFAYKGEGSVGSGEIIKKKQGNYVFLNGKEVDIINNLTDEQEAITRGYSYGLRHRGHIKFAVEQLNKTKGDLTSFTKALARVLKKYIPDGEKSTVSCNECGSTNVVFEEGCTKCLDCGNSKCG